MRKEFAVFAGKKIVEKFFTEREAIAAVKDGQHVRWWINNKWLHRETVMTADMEIRLARAINENDRKEVEIYARVLRLLREKKPTQQDIMGMYYPMHCCCPSCGSDSIQTTCVGYMFNNVETAKDGNRATCGCGWRGVVHDLGPSAERL